MILLMALIVQILEDLFYFITRPIIVHDSLATLAA
jgi:hypothetical protein